MKEINYKNLIDNKLSKQTKEDNGTAYVAIDGEYEEQSGYGYTQSEWITLYEGIITWVADEDGRNILWSDTRIILPENVSPDSVNKIRLIISGENNHDVTSEITYTYTDPFSNSNLINFGNPWFSNDSAENNGLEYGVGINGNQIYMGAYDTFISNGDHVTITGYVTSVKTIDPSLIPESGVFEKGEGEYSIQAKNDTSISATGNYAVAQGFDTQATGIGSHAEGNRAITNGNNSHAEGFDTRANGNYSHAEGSTTISEGGTSHTEGEFTRAKGTASHAEGDYTVAYGDYSHAEGGYNSSPKIYLTGSGTTYTSRSALYDYYLGKIIQSFVVKAIITSIDITNKTITVSSSLGNLNSNSCTIYLSPSAYGVNSHAEGTGTLAHGVACHSEGKNAMAIGLASHAEGLETISRGQTSHAEGGSSSTVTLVLTGSGPTYNSTNTLEEYYMGQSISYNGINTYITGINKTAGTVIVQKTLGALDSASITITLHTVASGDGSHAEGYITSSSNSYTHAEGYYTSAKGSYSHAEGHACTSSGLYAHAEGDYSIAKAQTSHAEGSHTIASGYNQHASGKYNIEDLSNKYAEIVGIGTSDSSRDNGRTLDWNGNEVLRGSLEARYINSRGGIGLNYGAEDSVSITASKWQEIIDKQKETVIFSSLINIDHAGETVNTFSTPNRIIDIEYYQYLSSKFTIQFDNEVFSDVTKKSDQHGNGYYEVGNSANTGCKIRADLTTHAITISTTKAVGYHYLRVSVIK